jgi:hypothetical protein
MGRHLAVRVFVFTTLSLIVTALGACTTLGSKSQEDACKPYTLKTVKGSRNPRDKFYTIVKVPLDSASQPCPDKGK